MTDVSSLHNSNGETNAFVIVYSTYFLRLFFSKLLCLLKTIKSQDLRRIQMEHFSIFIRISLLFFQTLFLEFSQLLL